ncbi:MAG: hypothetical protein VKS61_08250 [Candidatus Sericytochromatia bacterium]|nr:hypothetical protein [Candidatus Sericytochromatia bacterium]
MEDLQHASLSQDPLEEAGPDDYTVPELVPPYAVHDSVIEDNRIGQLLIRSRILTVDTLETCLALQAHHPGRLLGEIVVEQGHATVEDIHAALRAQLADLRLGQILLRTRCITPAQLDIALVEQENTGELLGSILIGYGFCTPEMIGWAIDQQNKD